jgi:hypothetical protein
VNGVPASVGDGDLYGGGLISAGVLPEPGTLFLLTAGGLAVLRPRRRSAAAPAARSVGR